MPDTPRSRNGVPIRLSEERWAHIAEEHAELAGMRDGFVITAFVTRRIRSLEQREQLWP